MNAPRAILLIHPPVAKPGEPPAGMAKLVHTLQTNGVDCRLYDASLDGLLGLLDAPLTAEDTWTRRALAHRRTNIESLRNPTLYTNPDRYKRAVMDVNRVIAMAGQRFRTTVSLANYADPKLSPVRSRDLIRAAENVEQNPFYPVFSQRLREYFETSEPDIIGLSINFMSQALGAFAIIGFIRKHLPGKIIVCGGGLITSWMSIPGFDNPFHGLVDELVSGPGEARLAYLCTGKILGETPVTGYDFSLLETERYLSPRPVLPYATTRGCWWKKCSFCPEKAEDSRYRSTIPESVTAELLQKTAGENFGLIHFLDNALPPRLLSHLCAHPLPVPWYGFARITHHLTDESFVRGLRQSGCVMLKLGVESGDQSVLDAMHKGNNLEMTAKALHTLNRAGIATYVYLLFGTPSEDEAAAEKTLIFTLENAAAIDFLNLAIFNLPAYSLEADDYETVAFYEGDLSLYREFVHPKGWNRDRVRRFLSQRFKKPATIRKIINNDPPFFTSNHAPFLVIQKGITSRR